MTSIFNVHKASGYEKLMGRWSRKLAPQFIKFSELNGGDRVLDVGCGTGSLTFALTEAADVAEVVAIDYSPVFVDEARSRNNRSTSYCRTSRCVCTPLSRRSI